MRTCFAGHGPPLGLSPWAWGGAAFWVCVQGRCCSPCVLGSGAGRCCRLLSGYVGTSFSCDPQLVSTERLSCPASDWQVAVVRLMLMLMLMLMR